MRNSKRTVVGIIMLFIANLAVAQERKAITLSEAIDLSIKNSKQLKISTAKIEEATATLKESENRRLPDASVSASYLRLGTANIDIKKQNNSGGSNGESPKVSQAAYGILNASLPLYAGGRIR